MNNHIIHSLLLGIWLVLCNPIFAQNIPENRLTDWSQAGLVNEIPDASLVVSVSDFGAVGNGISNDSEAIEAALDYIDGQEACLFFPSGNYLLTQPINFHTGLSLKGAGANLSRLNFNLSSDNQHCLVIIANQSSDFRVITDGFEKNSHSINVNNSSGFAPGDYVEIQQENGDWDTNPVSWAQNAVGQILQIESINGNQIELNKGLRIDYLEELNPVIRTINPIENIKIENISLERLDEPDSGGGKNIYLSAAVNVQISGVESIKSQGSHIYATRSSHIFVFGNYLHAAHIYDGSDTRGYGVTLNMHTGNSLIENNIFRDLRHAMMVKTGANGNVFSYNYSREPHRSEPIANYSGDISIHGHYAYANLFEENIVQNLFIDHYWGPGGPLNTFFRNRTELYGIMMTSNDELETQSQNFIANEISGGFPYGFYVLTGSDHFEYGNNDGGSIIPQGTDIITDESYYYTQAPWYLETEFPTIGYPNDMEEHIIPAKERWLNGVNYTQEWQPNTVGTEETKNINTSLRLLNNPVKDQLIFELNEPEESNISFYIYNQQGQLVYSSTLNKHSTQNSIDISELSSGYYFFSIRLLHQQLGVGFIKQ